MLEPSPRKTRRDLELLFFLAFFFFGLVVFAELVVLVVLFRCRTFLAEFVCLLVRNRFEDRRPAGRPRRRSGRILSSGLFLIRAALGADRFGLAEVVELRSAAVTLKLFSEIGHFPPKRRPNLACEFSGVNRAERSRNGGSGPVTEAAGRALDWAPWVSSMPELWPAAVRLGSATTVGFSRRGTSFSFRRAHIRCRRRIARFCWNSGRRAPFTTRTSPTGPAATGFRGWREPRAKTWIDCEKSSGATRRRSCARPRSCCRGTRRDGRSTLRAFGRRRKQAGRSLATRATTCSTSIPFPRVPPAATAFFGRSPTSIRPFRESGAPARRSKSSPGDSRSPRVFWSARCSPVSREGSRAPPPRWDCPSPHVRPTTSSCTAFTISSRR